MLINCISLARIENKRTNSIRKLCHTNSVTGTNSMFSKHKITVCRYKRAGPRVTDDLLSPLHWRNEQTEQLDEDADTRNRSGTRARLSLRQNNKRCVRVRLWINVRDTRRCECDWCGAGCWPMLPPHQRLQLMVGSAGAIRRSYLRLLIISLKMCENALQHDQSKFVYYFKKIHRNKSAVNNFWKRKENGQPMIKHVSIDFHWKLHSDS